ncbi:hypothetical protein Y032_0248g87 [Ancylostoma ceylanicum]|uniref:Lipid-binding serum glycoprotein N-terminal domain-containing protein n=1 Tax=Ancylostoma ceylanicum TaxID=53326 RepID=A0A016SCJ7_9BILA|nr:hypothetical protein Y032_0248g87 [Ancylostoma ceylanicum]
MLIFALLCTVVTIGTIRCHSKFDEPLTVTISPKIFDLFETNAHVINAAGANITIPERRLQYFNCFSHIRNGKVKHLSLLKSGASFQNFNKGVHLRMSAQYSGTIQVKAVGFFFASEPSFRSTSSVINVRLTWDDFSFTVIVSVNSNVQLSSPFLFPFFICGRRMVVLMQNTITTAVDSEIQRMIAGAVKQQLNPLLQKLKQKVIAMGYTQYLVEWTVEENLLRVTVKPKSWNGVVSAISPIDNMFCINGIMAAATTDEIPNRLKAAAVTNDADFTCVPPELNCGRTSCSLCADLKLVLSNSTDVQICDNQGKHSVDEAVTLTISPKIWYLLDKKAPFINKAVTSIKIPEIRGKLGYQ